ncbi:MAG: dethiobiotin synthase [Alphaproteobacteria bacterium]|nr:dethiobiotin synthase [Alphaproteobacteria bacterium]
MSLYVIAGAGTDIGKTYVTRLLIARLRAAGRAVQPLKPVASGVADLTDPAFADSDTARLLDALGETATAAAVEACSPWRFREPLSPDMAAAAEGREVRLEAVLAWIRARRDAAPAGTVTLLEGVGGVMSPMTSDALNLAVIKALAAPVVLVTGSYLGAISHALTALETLKAHGAAVHAVVVNETAGSGVDFAATMASLARHAPQARFIPLRQHARAIDLDLA